VVKIKKLADNVNFLRLYFLKSADDQVNANPESAYFTRGGLEIVDCVMAIFLFEIFRLFRSGRSLYSKD
jgi:hypothetical protein